MLFMVIWSIISTSYSTSILPNDSSASEITSEGDMLQSSNFLVGLKIALFMLPNDIMTGISSNFRGGVADRTIMEDCFFSSFSEICSRLGVNEFFAFSLIGVEIEFGVDPARLSFKAGFGTLIVGFC